MLPSSATVNVVPPGRPGSAAAFATVPLPPAFVSTINACGKILSRCATAATFRNRMSVPPPGAYALVKVICLSGNLPTGFEATAGTAGAAAGEAAGDPAGLAAGDSADFAAGEAAAFSAAFSVGFAVGEEAAG